MDIQKLFAQEIDAIVDFFNDEEINDDLVSAIIENSVYIYLGLRQVEEQSTFSSYERNWIKRCAIELLSKGVEHYGVSSYSENGYSVSYYSDLISQSLKNEVFPKLKVI